MSLTPSTSTTERTTVFTTIRRPVTTKLRRRRSEAGQLSLRDVSKKLATRGFLNELGKPYAAKSVASMLR
jgi:hypothetical protein